MASEKVTIKDKMSIKKTTVNKEGKPIKTTYFFPDEGKSVEASSREEAEKMIKR